MLRAMAVAVLTLGRAGTPRGCLPAQPNGP